MLHTISGNNFHGGYCVQIRGPAEPFVLSAAQARRLDKALCPHNDCTCDGGYGEGPDKDSADTCWAWEAGEFEIRLPKRTPHDATVLIPAGWAKAADIR